MKNIFQGESDPSGKGIRIRKPEKKEKEIDLSITEKKLILII